MEILKIRDFTETFTRNLGVRETYFSCDYPGTYLESQGIKSCLDALDEWEKKQNNKNNSSLSLEAQVDLLRQENEQLKAIIQQLLESLKTD